MPSESDKIRRLFKELVGVAPIRFPQTGMRLDVPKTHGVYIIYSPRRAVLHVGRTHRGKNGLRQRLNNHLHGASSFTIRFFRGSGSRLRKKYMFAYLEVSDARTRALLEAFAAGNLCPKHLGTGKNDL